MTKYDIHNGLLLDSLSDQVCLAMLRNFLKQYMDGESMELKKLSANQFMEIWENYDKDGINTHCQNT